MIGLLFHIVIFVTLLVIAIKTSKRVINQKNIFSEYGQSKILLYLVYLLPIGPLLLLIGPYFIPGLFVLVLVVSCFLPVMVIAKRQNNIFETAGTDRVKGANEAVSGAFSGAFIGLIYVAVNIVFTLAVVGYSGS